MGERDNCLVGYLAAVSRKLPAPLAVIVQSTSAAANSAGGVTRVFCVEGPGNARLNISAGGDVSIKGDNMLFLNFGDEARVQEFLAQRLAQGHDGTIIRSFDVPTSYANDVAARAVPESMARGSSVISVDTTKTASSYGLRSSEFPGLQRAIIPGSGC